jgi:integral membrane protein
VGADGIAVAVRRYRIMAYVTGVVLIFLCFVGIPLQVFAHNAVVANDVGTAHGILYLIYLAAAYLMTRRVGMKLASPQTVLVLLAGTIPVLTFVVERWVTRRYINPALAAAQGRAGGKDRAGGKMTAGRVPAQDPVPRPPVQRSG